MPLSQWHHVLVRVENNVPDFYVNGVITGKYADTIFTRTPTGNTSPLLIGARDDGLEFHGRIDEVMIFDRALSPEEIQQLYQNSRGACGDYHLQSGSPCIDIGDNSVVEPDATDLDGNERIIDGIVDMGAFEAPAVIQADLDIRPRVINRNNRRARILARVRLPEEVTIDQIDRKQALVLLPGEIEAERQDFFSTGSSERKVVHVFAFFDKDKLMQAVPDNGDVELTVTGRLNDGRIYSGTDIVTIVGRTQSP
jgi:hypothetical protein